VQIRTLAATDSQRTDGLTDRRTRTSLRNLVQAEKKKQKKSYVN